VLRVQRESNVAELEALGAMTRQPTWSSDVLTYIKHLPLQSGEMPRTTGSSVKAFI
jgi:hypothetical protein